MAPPLPSSPVQLGSQRPLTEISGTILDQVLNSLKFRADEKLSGSWMCKDVKSIIQDGPMCGLVAASMASQLFGEEVPTEILFEHAKKLGFTRNGEMFSVYHMKALLESLLQVDAQVVESTSVDSSQLIGHLHNGWPILVPYDADGNHEPCLKRGHKAHWAVAVGCCALSSESHDFEQVVKVESALELVQREHQFYVFAKQGKSRYLKAWNFEQLWKSNQNLEEPDPKLDKQTYVIPPRRNF
ncbi:UPF0692 protein C19orf54 -like protein [Halotydeus destructor]|nr:UPF0692 protein C19orf54 -like protein [Halotydeus destructor]